MAQQPPEAGVLIDLTAEDEDDELVVLWTKQVDHSEPVQSTQEDDIEVVYDANENSENVDNDENDCEVILEKIHQKGRPTSTSATRLESISPPPQLSKAPSPSSMEVDCSPEPSVILINPKDSNSESMSISLECEEVSKRMSISPGSLEVPRGGSSPGTRNPQSINSNSVASLRMILEEEMPEEPLTPTTKKVPAPGILMERNTPSESAPIVVSTEKRPEKASDEQMPEEQESSAQHYKKTGSAKKKSTEKSCATRPKRRCIRYDDPRTHVDPKAPSSSNSRAPSTTPKKEPSTSNRSTPSTSNKTAPSTSNSSERPKKSPKFYPPDPTVWGQDRRRGFSIRTFAKRPSPEEDETPEDSHPESDYISSVKFFMPRNQTIPTGLSHTPFHVELPQNDLIDRLNIRTDKEFPQSVPKGIQYSRKGERDLSNVMYYSDDSNNSPNGLAIMEDFRGSKPAQSYMNKKDKEELMWSADDLEKYAERNPRKMNKDQFYDDVKNKYLFAIWRQFEGHIPPEFALQNLMKRRYKIPKALETIDQYLKVLPQKLKNPSVAQVQVLHRELKAHRESFDLRKIQDDIMRNFHIGEVFNYHVKFRRFFGVDNDNRELGGGLTGTVGCNCLEPMCRELEFEPRYGCYNCTKSLRKHPVSADRLCLICITYADIAGKSRPAKKVVFDEDDMEMIRLWDQKCKEMNRKDFEKWMQNEKNKRYKALELTQEEALMLNLEKRNLKEKKNNLGDYVKSMLQPYVLPHFSHCQCQYSGGIPVGTPNFGKTRFSKEEVQKFVAAISETPGNIKTAAATLGVEEELVEVFLKTHKAGSNVWKDLRRSVRVHIYPPREIQPPINPPPPIPRIGAVSK